jgi:N-methylhydantoinase A
VATNALLERKGAKTALITTKGFKDILLIGRQNRPALYDWTINRPQPLIPSDLTFEVSERINHHGIVEQALEKSQIDNIINQLSSHQVQSVAVSLLFSFLHPEHEEIIARQIRSEGILVSASSEIIPEYREYERTSTTVVNAYVSPILDKYLTTLSESLPHSQLLVMQANGVRCILSGPAGGVVGAQYLGTIAQSKIPNHIDNNVDLNLITFDMGGTSTDVSLITQEPMLTKESMIGDCPISIPVLDILTIGAGGGSIAQIDQGGALRVGPLSAGANPGPACYGYSDFPTVTDANVILGRLIPDFFLDGKMRLDVNRSFHALENLGSAIGLDAIQTALGVIQVVNAHMERALRVISVERGLDPRDYQLFSFGGAGGLHSVELARNLNIPRLIVSPYASVMSAFGMLTADITRDYVQTVMLTGESHYTELAQKFDPLIERGMSDILSEGISPNNILIQQFADVRYQGQSYELSIPFSQMWINDFHHAYQKTYGYQPTDTKVELVNIRVRTIGKTSPPIPFSLPESSSDPLPAFICTREVIYPTKPCMVPFYQYDLLKPGNKITGAAIIVKSDTTILIGEQDQLFVDAFLNLIVTVGRS